MNVHEHLLHIGLSQSFAKCLVDPFGCFRHLVEMIVRNHEHVFGSQFECTVGFWQPGYLFRMAQFQEDLARAIFGGACLDDFLPGKIRSYLDGRLAEDDRLGTAVTIGGRFPFIRIVDPVGGVEDLYFGVPPGFGNLPEWMLSVRLIDIGGRGEGRTAAAPDDQGRAHQADRKA